MLELDYNPTRKQMALLTCPADEILYGGSAGGGKTAGTTMLAYKYGMCWQGLRIGCFRQSLRELDETIIKEVMEKFPKNTYKYMSSKRKLLLLNGSQITFNFIEGTLI